ncbi:hypothetical protein, partial [Leucobacter sp. M11]|uniref:hypothetical protein n=1 Tax=Leucobacter sp. M11 TaxID=2993565 RepID=UPI002D80237A
SAALGTIDAALTGDPEHRALLGERAQLLYGLSRYAESRATAASLLELDPADAVGGYMLAYSLSALGEHDAAVAEARRLIARTPDWASGQHLLAHVLLIRNGSDADLRESLEHAQITLRLDPENANAIETLLLLSLRITTPQSSLEYLRTGLTLEPNSERFLVLAPRVTGSQTLIDDYSDALLGVLAEQPNARDAQAGLVHQVLTPMRVHAWLPVVLGSFFLVVGASGLSSAVVVGALTAALLLRRSVTQGRADLGPVLNGLRADELAARPLLRWSRALSWAAAGATLPGLLLFAQPSFGQRPLGLAILFLAVLIGWVAVELVDRGSLTGESAADRDRELSGEQLPATPRQYGSAALLLLAPVVALFGAPTLTHAVLAACGVLLLVRGLATTGHALAASIRRRTAARTDNQSVRIVQRLTRQQRATLIIVRTVALLVPAIMLAGVAPVAAAVERL